MIDDRTLERAARSFIEEGPTAAPPRVVEEALRLIDHIPQERDWIPWRFPNMFNPARIAVLVAVIGAIVLGGAFLVLRQPSSRVGNPDPCASPASTPIPTATGITDSDLRVTFTSVVHGYSVRIPCGWTASPATTTWAGDAPDATAEFMDRLQGTTVRLVAASAALAGQTPESWMEAYANRFGLDGVGECDVLPADWPRITIGGQAGYLDGNGCVAHESSIPDAVFYEAVTFVDGRVYLFWLEGRVDRAYVDAMLSTVRFDASSAIDDAAASPKTT